MSYIEGHWKIEDSEGHSHPQLNLSTDQLEKVIVLPERTRSNDENTPVFSVHAPTVRAILKEQGIESVTFSSQTETRYYENRSASWIGPTLLIAWPLYSSNPNVVSVVLNIISSHLYDMFSALRPSSEVQFECIIETNEAGSLKKISYKGPASGMRDAKEILKRLD